MSWVVGIITAGALGGMTATIYKESSSRDVSQKIVNRWGTAYIVGEPGKFAVQRAYQEGAAKAGVVGGVTGAVVMLVWSL
jgi:hypothetical protein